MSAALETFERVQLPEGWRWTTLGSICSKPQYGWTTKARHVVGVIKLIRTTDITSGAIDWATVPYCTEQPEKLDKYLVREGDILISRAGSVGFSHLVTHVEPAVFASYLIRFRPSDEVSAKYIAYFLRSPGYWRQISDSSAGIAVQNVNASKLEQIVLPLAPRDQQDEIVADFEKQFSRLDDAFTNLQRVKANLKRYKAAVLQAAMSGEWERTPLAEIAETASGGTPSRGDKRNFGGHIPWVKSGELGDGIVTECEERITESGLENSSAKVFPKGTLCIAMYGATVGKLGVLGIEAATNQAVCAIFPGERVSRDFLKLNLLSVRDELIHLGQGGAQPNISQRIIRSLQVPIPSRDEQDRIVAEVERRFSLIAGIESQVEASLARASATRSAILHRAFSG